MDRTKGKWNEHKGIIKATEASHVLVLVSSRVQKMSGWMIRNNYRVVKSDPEMGQLVVVLLVLPTTLVYVRGRR